MMGRDQVSNPDTIFSTDATNIGKTGPHSHTGCIHMNEWTPWGANDRTSGANQHLQGRGIR